MLKLECPLCSDKNSIKYHSDSCRRYWQCGRCALVYVDPAQRLSSAQEKAEYDKHQNSAQDTGYRKFLSRLCDPLSDCLPASAQGMDFGCGPGPALSSIMAERGFSISDYDIFYADDRELLNRSYDFITATEVVEHLFEPGAVLAQLWRLINAGGVLALMTKMVIDKNAFAKWHYKNDQTHVCFFSIETFQYLAGQLNAELSIVDQDVIFLKKK